MKQRLQKILSDRGVTSRRKAETWIQQGRVSVNGRIATVGETADADVDEIRVDGTPIPAPAGYIYLMLNKPRGYVTTLSDEKGRPTAAQLVSSCAKRVYPVGRLDMDSEGLLLFTNDGAFANEKMHPSFEISKTYRVLVDGFSEENFRRLHDPITLDGYTIRPPQLHLLGQAGNRATFEITIHEGRNRQIRRMCQAAGMTVLRLKRIREGTLELGDLPVGHWRYLTAEEIEKLSAPKGEIPLAKRD